MSVYYKFIGDFSTAKMTKNQQFCVKITDEEQSRISTYPYPEYMTATIASVPSPKNNHFNWMVGDTVHKFLNPYAQMHKYGFPNLVLIPYL